MDEVVVEHTTLIAEAQGNIEILIAEAWRKNHKIDRLRGLVDEFLTQVTVMEGQMEHPIEILDSPLPVPLLPPHVHTLVPIEDLNLEGEEDDGVDLEEVFRVRLGEEYADGETILDVLWRRNARAKEVPKYEEASAYDNPGYVSDH